MPRPISAEIDLEALRRNLGVMREKAQGRTLWAVVKANAYGHGLDHAVKAFADADGLATIDLCDAEIARRCGWGKRILLLEGFFDKEDIKPLQALKVETVVHSPWQIEILKNTSPDERRDVRVHVKVNSGMNRLGFRPAEAPAAAAALAAIPGVRVIDYVTHFANAELSADSAPVTVGGQLSAMGALAEGRACLANTGAILFHPEVGGEAVRAGVALYGVSPDDKVSSEALGLTPAMTLGAEIIAIQEVLPGESVGYGSRWKAARPSRIAVVACGYADGYPRTMPDGAPVWVEGARAPLAGAVSMDMLTIDVTDVPQAHVGSKVELWGRHIAVNDLARMCGTIGYELLCALARRVPLVLKG